MTTYNISRQPGPLGANTGGPGGTELAPIQDSIFTNPGGMQAGSSFYGVDANITSVSNVSYTGTGTKDGHVTINFTYTGATTTNGIAEIYYGLYIAEPRASAEPGQRYHEGRFSVEWRFSADDR